MNPPRNNDRFEKLFSDVIPENDDVILIDIIPLEHLQSLQEKFSIANGVASVILDLDGKSITQPSNINQICKTLFYENEKCFQTNRLIDGIVDGSRPCKLFEAKSPIYIDGIHVADWKIGMCGFGEIIAPFMRAACDTIEKFEEIYVKLYGIIQKHFQSVCDLLQMMTNEISEIGYNNVRLARELIKQEETKAKLAENAITFRSIFNNSVDGISLIGNDGKVKEWSLGYEKLTGIPKELAVGKDVSELFNTVTSCDCYSEDEKKQLHDRLNIVVSKKEQSTITRHIVNQKTKQGLIINTLYFPVYLPEGTMIGAIARDITENVSKENELLAEKERLEALGNNLPEVVLYQFAANPLTGEMKYTYLSKSWETVMGIPAEVALNDIGMAISMVHPDDLPVLMQKIDHSVRTLDNFYDEYRIIVNDSFRWIRMASRLHRTCDWVVADGVIIDINKQKENELKLESYRNSLELAVREQTEALQAANEELYATNEELYATNEEFAVTNEELHKKNKQLQQEISARLEVMQKLEYSENMMRNFFTQTFEGIVMIDPEGRIIEWNPEQERITEISREEAIGEYCWSMYKRLLPDDIADEMTNKFRNQVLTLLQDEGNHPTINEMTHILLIPGKGERYITITSFPIVVVDKCYLGEIVRDITERKLIDDELECYRTQLEKMVALQTKELIESKERLTSLSDNLPGGVIYQMCCQEGQALHFTYISARYADLFQTPVENVMEDCSLFFRMFHPEDQHKVLDLFGSSQTEFADAECRLCFDSGEIKWIHLRSSFHLLDDQTMVWDGFMVDNTDRKHAEQELEETRRRQNILIKVLQIVQSSTNINDAINISLLEIGRFAGVSRSYIFEKSTDGKTVRNSYEWCNDGIVPEIENLQNLPYFNLHSWFDIFAEGEIICTSDIATLKPEVYDILEPQGIKSILVLPLMSNGINYGFVGFDDCLQHKEWNKNEVELLISLSQIISSTTRRFRAEEAINLSQQTMRTVLDNINANIIVTDFNTYELMFVNKSVKNYIGEDVEGKQCWKVLQKDMTGPCDFCPNPKLLDKDNKPTGLYRWQYQNKKLNQWLECTDAAIEWVDGRLVHMEYATDITDRRMAEEALRQSEELYRQLTVASPDAIVVSDPMGIIVYMSPRAKELFNICNDSDTGEIKMNRYVHPHDLQKFADLFQSLAEDNVSFLPQLLMMREDGSDFFGEISSASVKDEQGNTASIIMVIRDITERKMNEMELIRAKEKAEESDKLKSAFLANMSHEIRTPINGIIGFLNFLADDNLSPKRRHDYITVVNNSSVQLVKLIDDIIDIAKIEAKQMSLRPTLFHLNEFMSELQVFFDTYLQANNKDKIALILDDSQFIEPDVTFIDPMRLRQVLSNLIGNAIKFTEKGYIGFGYRPLPPDKLEFWVEDSGIGLAPDQLEVIFERFRQAELTNSRKYGGTGLGLTISRSLVQMMGGDIHVGSVQGEGSTFRFTISYLPIKTEDEPLFDENNTETTSVELPFSEMAVLLVIPEIMTYRYYEKLLAPTGATLIHAQTVKQWIDTISQRKHINIALVDARVFQNEDEEAFRQVRSIRAGLPLILVIPEKNGYYSHMIDYVQCNRVISGIAGFEDLYLILEKYQ